MLVTHRFRGQPEWMDDAACATAGNYFIWHSDNPQDQAEAKRICAGCPVRNQCLQLAFETGDGWAVMGGTTPQERGRVRTEQTTKHGQYSWAKRTNCHCRACRDACATYEVTRRAQQRSAQGVLVFEAVVA